MWHEGILLTRSPTLPMHFSDVFKHPVIFKDRFPELKAYSEFMYYNKLAKPEEKKFGLACYYGKFCI